VPAGQDAQFRAPYSGAGDVTYFDVFQGAEKSENLQQVDDYRNHNDGVQDAFDFAVHGNVVVYQPEEHSDYDQDTDDVKEGHEVVLLVILRAATFSGQQKFHGIGTAGAIRAQHENPQQ